eukprot:scaffold604_cov59-Phaeocystis_antarctica.AAC.3
MPPVNEARRWWAGAAGKIWPQLQQVAASLLPEWGADSSRSYIAAEQLPLDATDRVGVRDHRGERLHPAAPAARIGVRPRDALAPEADEVEQWRHASSSRDRAPNLRG